MKELQHSIRVAARLTGLSAHVIRIWEKRYGVIEPFRTGTNRRLYSAEDIEKLTLLRKATLAGHSIGNVAGLSVGQLKSLVRDEEGQGELKVRQGVGITGQSDFYLEKAEKAVLEMDARVLQDSLQGAELALGAQGLLILVIAPLTHRIGDMWREGKISAAHEHFASAIIRDFLFQSSHGYYRNGNSPVMVSATPAGQIHELGATMVAAGAYNLGWKVNYLGVDLPAAEIAGAAQQNGAKLVALSIVYPHDDATLPLELEKLRRLLPDQVALLVGGQSAFGYLSTLESIGAKVVNNLEECFAALDSIRLLPQKSV